MKEENDSHDAIRSIYVYVQMSQVQNWRYGALPFEHSIVVQYFIEVEKEGKRNAAHKTNKSKTFNTDYWS